MSTTTSTDYARRMLAAIKHVIDAAGALPGRTLVRTVAAQHGVQADDLAERALAVLLAGASARSWLRELAEEEAARKCSSK